MGTQPVQSVFESLWQDYTAFNPRAKQIYDRILAREQTHDPSVRALVNDHVALRTFNVSPIGLKTLAALFEKYGYQQKGEYTFVEKKLYAQHFEHPDKQMPKVFISELETEKLSSRVQQMVKEVAATFTPELLKKDELLWSGRTWKASHARYQELLAESEYAAWVYAFGFRANHFTISVNDLKSFKSLQDLNVFVREAGYPLNTSGGEVKGTPEQLLEQSSTLAEKVNVKFEEGTFEIPSCYYEFARRYPKADGQLYTGFIAASADKIFESTNVRR